MVTNALGIFFGWILRAVGIFILAIAWLAFLGLWGHIGDFSLAFIYGSWAWAIGLSIAGGLALAFSFAMS